MKIYERKTVLDNKNDKEIEIYRFTEDFVKLIQLRLALEIAHEKNIKIDDFDAMLIGTKAYWSATKLMESTEKVLGEPVTFMTMRRFVFCNANCLSRPSDKTIDSFCTYMGIGTKADAEKLAFSALEERIINHVYDLPCLRKKHLHSIIEGESNVAKNESRAFVKIGEDIEYVISSYLRKDRVVEVKLNDHNEETYAFLKRRDDENRFKVIDCPKDSQLKRGDLLSIESFAVNVSINGYNLSRFVDSFPVSYGIYISKGTIISITSHY